MRRTSLLVLFALCSGCTTPPRPAPAVPAPAARPDPHGKVALEVLPDPSAHAPEFRPDEEFVPPKLVGAPLLPEYPPDALASKSPAATVIVRMTIGTDGRVKSVTDSPRAVSTPGPFANEFRAATERAIRRWHFSPGRVDRIAKDDNVTRVIASTPVDVFYDLRVEFRIVDGKPVVETNP